MLIKAKELKGYQLDSIDGTIGSVREFYFDDQYWSIRYLVRQNSWLAERQQSVVFILFCECSQPSR